MKSLCLSVRTMMVVLAVLAIATIAPANVWMDETFEGTSVFVQGNGVAGGVPGATLDPYAYDTLTSTVTTSPLIQTGAQSAAKAFEGAKSYKLESGQTLSAGTQYANPTNGSFQIFQFAINFDPIPSAGTVAVFRWNFDMDKNNPPTVDNSFYVKAVSDGTTVTLKAGEDVAHTVPTETTIGALSATNRWAFISVVVQKDEGSKSHGKIPLVGSLAQGVYFYNSSWTPSATIPLTGGSYTTFLSRNWSFQATGGAIYIDDLYWEGGMDGDAGNSKLHDFNLTGSNPPSGIRDWPQMK